MPARGMPARGGHGPGIRTRGHPPFRSIPVSRGVRDDDHGLSLLSRPCFPRGADPRGAGPIRTCPTCPCPRTKWISGPGCLWARREPAAPDTKRAAVCAPKTACPFSASSHLLRTPNVRRHWRRESTDLDCLSNPGPRAPKTRTLNLGPTPPLKNCPARRMPRRIGDGGTRRGGPRRGADRGVGRWRPPTENRRGLRLPPVQSSDRVVVLAHHCGAGAAGRAQVACNRQPKSNRMEGGLRPTIRTATREAAPPRVGALDVDL